MKHSKNIKNYKGTLEELAVETGDLYYDSLADLLKLLSEKINKDGDADYNRGRVKLAKELHQCAEHLSKASKNIDKAWDICKPFMEK